MAQHQHPAARGTKRPADTPAEHEQRLTKRFDLLNLRASPPDAPRPPRPPRPPSDTAMHVDDTPHRVYIHDLAAELSDVESDDDHPVFLSDIEKHLSKIPPHVLRAPDPQRTPHNQLVLYHVPSSLSVPPHQDSVRKAIVDARQRIRHMQANPLAERDTAPVPVPVPVPPPAVEDAMDID
ncbi:hypothetical protein ACEQ8H_006823 [Pleosporales sp. CAS-2024a]